MYLEQFKLKKTHRQGYKKESNKISINGTRYVQIFVVETIAQKEEIFEVIKADKGVLLYQCLCNANQIKKILKNIGKK